VCVLNNLIQTGYHTNEPNRSARRNPKRGKTTIYAARCSRRRRKSACGTPAMETTSRAKPQPWLVRGEGRGVSG